MPYEGAKLALKHETDVNESGQPAPHLGSHQKKLYITRTRRAVTASLSPGYDPIMDQAAGLADTRGQARTPSHRSRRNCHSAVWPVSRPSGTGYRCLADQHLSGSGCDRLVHLLDAAPLGCQQEQRLAVRSTEHGGEDRAVVLDALQHLAALADPHDRALEGIVTTAVGADVRCLNPDGTFGIHADAVRTKAFC